MIFQEGIFLSNKIEEKKMRIIAITNQKGGVAKTTSTKEIGIALSRTGRKVLFIDLDPQANLSKRFKIINPDISISEILQGEKKLEEGIVEITEKLHIIPSSERLSLLKYFQVPNKETILSKRFKNTKLDYDYILIDTNPDFGDYTFNALSVAQKIYIPIQVEGMALEGVNVFKTGIKLAQEYVGDFQIAGVFCTMLDSRIKSHTENMKEVKEFFKDIVFDTVIRRNATVDTANTGYKSIFDVDINSTGAFDYMNLTLEIIKREEGIKIGFEKMKEMMKKGKGL
jgi:chromosome partitioning protein